MIILNLEIALECRSPVFVVLRTEGVNAEGLGYCAVLGAIVDEEGFLGTAWTMVMDLKHPSVTYYSRRHFDKPLHVEMKK